MDEIFDTFVNPQTVFLCLAIYVMTYVIRTVTESLWAGAKTNRYWRELWIPLGAIVNGTLLGFMAKTFVWPDMFSKTLAGRMAYGAICGMFSAFLYGRVRSWLASKSTNGEEKHLPPVAKKDASPAASEDVVDAPLGGHGGDETP
jgi:hypothetical protein